MHSVTLAIKLDGVPEKYLVTFCLNCALGKKILTSRVILHRRFTLPLFLYNSRDTLHLNVKWRGRAKW